MTLKLFMLRKKSILSSTRGKFVVVVNPSANDETVPFDFDVASTLYQIGKTEVKDNKVTAYGSSFAIFEVK